MTPGVAVIQIDLNNWPSVSSDDLLEIHMSLTTPGHGGVLQDNRLNLKDGASIYFPPTAELSGISSATTAVSSGGSGNQVTFTMSFNSTQSTSYAIVWNSTEIASSQSRSSTVSSWLSYLF